MKPTLALLIASLLPGFAGAQDPSTADALKPTAKPNILVIPGQTNAPQASSLETQQP